MTAPETPGEHDPFVVLGVPRDCSPETLHQAYRALARRFHPDVNTDAAAVADMRRINAAFDAARQELRVRLAISVPSASAPPASATPPATPPDASAKPGNAHGVPRYVRLARQVAWARTLLMRAVARPVWGLGVLLSAAGALAVLLVLARIGWIGTSSAVSVGDGVPVLALGRSTTTSWPGLGEVVLSEHQIATLPAGSYQNPSWSYDNQYVAVVANDTPGHTGHPAILVLDARGRMVRSLPGFTARWAPRADTLAILALPPNATVPELDLADIAAGTDRTLVAQTGNHLAWSPDGSRIVFSAQSQRVVRLLDTQTLRTSLLYAPPAGESATHVLPLGWFDAESVLCFQTAGATTHLALLQVATGALTPLPPALAGTNQQVAWNPASGQILFASQPSRQAAEVAQMLNRVTGAVRVIPGLRGLTLLAGWSADGSWLGAAIPRNGGATSAALCLVARPNTTPPETWSTRCLRLAGELIGLHWESRGERLSYLVRAGSSEQLREVAISLASAPTPTSLLRPPTQPLQAELPLLWLGMLPVFRMGRQRKARNEARHATTQTAGRPRLCVISEALKWPPDEALKRTALELARELERYGETLAIGTQGKRHPDDCYPALCLRVNRAFVSWPLWRQLWAFQPDLLFYLPGSGLTFFSLIRAIALRLACLAQWRRPVLVLVSIQPRALGWPGRWVLRALGPVRLVVQSPQRGAELARQGFATIVLAGGVDPGRFYPVDAERRETLRRRYDITSAAPVLLHVGHLKRDRNVNTLAKLKRRLPWVEVVLVASTSTVSDLTLKLELRRAGVKVFDEYLPHVEELYQLADGYVFPVRDARNCAEFPLSVLEALACGVPVITTRFGALPESLPPRPGIHFVDTAEDLFAAVAATLATDGAGRVQAHGDLALAAFTSAYGWERQVAHLMAALQPRDGLALTRRAYARQDSEIGKRSNARRLPDMAQD